MKRSTFILKQISVWFLIAVFGFGPLAPSAALAAVGDFSVYRTGTTTTAIGTGATDIDWNTTVTAATDIPLDGGGVDVDLDDGGHYLVMYSVPTEHNSGSNRSEIQSWLRINDTTDLAYGTGQSYIRRTTGHYEAYNEGAAIIDVTAGDQVRVQLQRSDANSATVRRRSDKSGINILKLDDAWTYLRSTMSANQSFDSTSWTNVDIDTDDEIDALGFSRTGSNMTLKDAGHYLVTYNVGIQHPSGSVRTNDETRLTLGGTEIDGTRGVTYMRGSQGTNDGVASWAGIIETTSAFQDLELQIRRDSSLTPGVQTIKAAQTGISIVKLSDTADYIRLGETAGGQALSTSRTAITWDETLEEDTNSFEHDGTTTSRINIDQDGDYLFFQSLYNTRTGTPNGPRASAFGEWRLNGSSVYAYGGAGSYNRQSNDSGGIMNSGGSSTGFIANGLLSTDYLELTQINEATAAGSTYSADRIGVQGVNIASLFVDQPYTKQLHYRWRDDSTDLNTTGGWIESEDTAIESVVKGDTYRLRMSVGNTGSLLETAARDLQLQFGLLGSDEVCSDISTWVGVDETATDAFDMQLTTHINPDGESTASALLANTEAYTYTAGEGLEIADATSGLSALPVSTHTELEYSITPTSNAYSAQPYCFRVYDEANTTELDSYSNYPQLTIEGTAITSTIGEFGQTTTTDTDWKTVAFNNTYADAIVVASLRYNQSTDTERTPRIDNITSTSFDIKVDNHDATVSGTTQIEWLAIERGTHTVDADTAGSFQIVADSVNTGTVMTTGAATSLGDTETYDTAFSTAPAVLHTVASDSDTDWVHSQVTGSASLGDLPSATNMSIGLACGFSTCGSRGAEDIHYIAIEPLHDMHGAFEFESGYTPENVTHSATGIANSFTSSFTAAPDTLLISNATINGTNGGWGVVHTATTPTVSAFYAAFDEGGVAADRAHTTEALSYIAFEGTSGDISGSGSTAVLALEQLGYRVYENIDAEPPTTALAAENTRASGVETSDVIRLRIAQRQSIADYAADSAAFALEYGAGDTCSDITTWTTVDEAGGSGIWRGYDNASVTDSADLTTSLLNGGSTTEQSYVEENNSPTNPNAFTVGGYNEWDWVVENNGADVATNYCFRMVKDNAEELNYAEYAEVFTTDAATITRLTPTVVLTDDTTVTFRVAFTSDMQNVDTSDFVLSTTGTAAGTINAVATAVSDTEYNVEVTGVSGDGTLNLDISGLHDIQNTLGVDFDESTGISSEEQYTIDQTDAAITITAPTKSDNASITDTTIQVTDANGITAVNVVPDGTSTVTVSSYSCAQTLSTQVDCTLNIDASGDLVISATDDAGNVGTATEATYIIDTTNPSLTSLSSSSGDANYGPADTINITATYNETVQAGSTLDVVLDNGETVSLTNASAGTDLVGTYTVGATGSGEDSTDLTVASLSTESVTDVVGNTQTGSSLPASPNNIADTSDIIVDTTAPASFAIMVDTNTPYTVDTPSITFSTTDAETSIDYYDVDIDGGGYSTQTSPYTPTLTAAATHSVTIRAYDTVGNYQEETTDYPPTVAITAPTILSTGTITDTTISVDGPNNITSISDSGGISSGLSCASLPAAGPIACTINITATGTLTITATDTSGATGFNSQSYVIDTTFPSLTSITTGTVDGTYGPTATMSITATYDEVIQSGGTLTVTLDNGEDVVLTNSASGTTLTGTYTVGVTGSGEDSSDLTVSSLSSETVTDTAGNVQSSSSVPSSPNNLGDDETIVVDTTAPTLAETTAVTDPTNDTTPDYIFTSSEAGTISYGGSCSSVTSAAASGSNTVALASDAVGTPFGDATYSDCTLTVTDTVNGGTSNVSSALAITSFEVDTVAPILVSFSSTTSDGTYGPTAAINITATYDEELPAAQTMDVTLSNGETVSLSSVGSTSTVVGTYTVGATASGQDDASLSITSIDTESVADLSGTVQSNSTLAGISGNTLADNTSLVIDTTAPALAEVTPVVTPTTDTTPAYVFTSNEVGTLSVGGSCDSATTAIVTGSNTISFDSDGAGADLTDATYSDCTVSVSDAVDGGTSNTSSVLTSAAFIVDTVSPSLVSFTTTAADGTYGPNGSIEITATYNEVVQAAADLVVVLDNGVSVGLTNVAAGTELIGYYAVNDTGSGESSTDLTVASITTESVLDEAGNTQSSSLVPSSPNNIADSSDIVIDDVAPVLAEVTAVTSPTSSSNPTYEFSSDTTGSITYGGSCNSVTTTATAATNTITLDTDGSGGGFTDATYNDCTLTVDDTVDFGDANVSDELTITTFTVDTDDPDLLSFSSSLVDGTYGPIAAVTVTATYDETVVAAGTINITLNNGETLILTAPGGTTTAVGTYTIGLTGSGEDIVSLDVSSIDSEAIADAAGSTQSSSTLAGISGNTLADNNAIEVDTTAPVIAEVTAVVTPTNDSTPNYTLNSDEVGNLVMAGSCNSSTTAMPAASATIILDQDGSGASLADGTYTDCTATVSDIVNGGSSNSSTSLAISSFTVDTTDLNIEITAPTTTNNSAITDTTIRVTDATGVLASAVTVTTSTVEYSTLNCTQTSATQVDCTIQIDGSGALVVAATDAAGNSSSTSQTGYEIDDDAPAAPQIITSTTDTTEITNSGVVATETPVVSGAGSEPGNTITVTDTSTGAVLCTATVASNGTWSCTSSVLAAGNHTIELTETDSFGNVSTAQTVTFTVELDVSYTITHKLVKPKKKKAEQGEFATYAITITNTGSTAISQAVIKERYSKKHLKFVSSSVEPNNSKNDGIITWSNLEQSIEPGEEYVIKAKFKVIKVPFKKSKRWMKVQAKATSVISETGAEGVKKSKNNRKLRLKKKPRSITYELYIVNETGEVADLDSERVRLTQLRNRQYLIEFEDNVDNDFDDFRAIVTKQKSSLRFKIEPQTFDAAFEHQIGIRVLLGGREISDQELWKSDTTIDQTNLPSYVKRVKFGEFL